MSTKAHAQHNKDVCDFLLSAGNNKYNDWVVTTAFYSAMHYVQSYIFPHQEGGVIFRDLDHYVTNSGSQQTRQTTKHAAVKQLVRDHLPTINREYRWLFDTCMTARYAMYKVKKATALEAQSTLLLIEQACQKKVVASPVVKLKSNR